MIPQLIPFCHVLRLIYPVYCDAGYTCSSTLGKCSYDTGSSGGLTGGSTSSYTYSYSSYTYPTSTSDGFLNTATSTATTTDSFGSSSTGITQNLDSGSGGNTLTVGMEWGLLVAAGVGVLVL